MDKHIELIASLCLFVATYIVVNPLKSSIYSLQKSIDGLKEAMDELNREITNLKVQAERTHASAKSAHLRIDGHDKRLLELEKAFLGSTYINEERGE